MFLMVICTFLFMNNVHAADDFCTDEGVKRVMYMAYIVITACKIIVPIILLVMGTIDMARAVEGFSETKNKYENCVTCILDNSGNCGFKKYGE